MQDFYFPYNACQQPSWRGKMGALYYLGWGKSDTSDDKVRKILRDLRGITEPTNAQIEETRKALRKADLVYRICAPLCATWSLYVVVHLILLYVRK
jgi:hypothetical protein